MNGLKLVNVINCSAYLQHVPMHTICVATHSTCMADIAHIVGYNI